MSCRPGFFLPVRPLSRLFRGKFLAHRCQQLAPARTIGPRGQPAGIGRPAAVRTWIDELRATEWVVYAKPPFGGPEQVLKYLARYTHRVAISNHRLVGIDDRTVSFQWKDYADGNTAKVMTLDGVEFIRRFLQHVLPSGFVRIRHFGFLANRNREESLARCRRLFGASPPPLASEPGVAKPASEPTTTDVAPPKSCPVCRVGRMVMVEAIPRHPSPPPAPIIRRPTRRSRRCHPRKRGTKSSLTGAEPEALRTTDRGASIMAQIRDPLGDCGQCQVDEIDYPASHLGNDTSNQARCQSVADIQCP